MSFEAIAWAMKQPVGRSSAKFLLVALADCVNDKSEEMLCFPSITHLEAATELDRKSVKANLQKLRELGFIEDTGQRRGQTRQIVVYLLKEPKNGPISGEATTTKEAQFSLERSPNLDQSQDDERGPNFPDKGPKFPTKEAQFSLERGPNLDHGTSKEPVTKPVMEPVKKNTREKSRFDALAVQLPDWLPADLWSTWVKDRADRKKPITEAAAALQFRKLGKLRGEGHDPRKLIERSIEHGWQGFFANDTTLASAGSTFDRPNPGGHRQASRHSGFENLDYSEGVNADGTLA
ncbi:MAG: helix-turn-helix domain-containing protein [Acidovorax sp.]